MGAWHDEPHAYPHHCVQCERSTRETGPFHRGSTITVAVRGGMGEVPYTLWTCMSCMRTAMAGERSPFAGWGPPPVEQVNELDERTAVPAGPVTAFEVLPTSALGEYALLSAKLDELLDQVDELIGRLPAKRPVGRPRKQPA